MSTGESHSSPSGPPSPSSPSGPPSPSSPDEPDEPDSPPSPSSPDEPDSPSSPDEPGYGAAMAELEKILEELEGEDPDVDVLANRVERAATLIEICRRRIANAGIQVERVVAALETDSPT